MGIDQAVLARRKKMKSPAGNLSPVPFDYKAALGACVLVPLEAMLEWNCAGRSCERGGASKLGARSHRCRQQLSKRVVILVYESVPIDRVPLEELRR